LLEYLLTGSHYVDCLGRVCLRLTFDVGEVEGLKRLACNDRLESLGFVVNLESGEVRDSLRETGYVAKVEFEVLQVLLAHYAKSDPVELSRKLVKFADLPGGRAYEGAFLKRAVQPIADSFGDKPERLPKCAKRLNGFALTYCDYSVEIPALPHLPLTIILWQQSEFPATATLLFDHSASTYLPTEDLAVLGELTTARLLHLSGIDSRRKLDP